MSLIECDETLLLAFLGPEFCTGIDFYLLQYFFFHIHLSEEEEDVKWVTQFLHFETFLHR